MITLLSVFMYTSYLALLWSHRDISGFCVGILVLCLSLLFVGHVFVTEPKDLEIGFALLLDRKDWAHVLLRGLAPQKEKKKEKN